LEVGRRGQPGQRSIRPRGTRLDVRRASASRGRARRADARARRPAAVRPARCNESL